jgi:putative phage-type endonuclease
MEEEKGINEMEEIEETEEIETRSNPRFIDTLSHAEKEDIYMTISELVEEYLSGEEVLKMSSHTFIDDFHSDITHLIFQQLSDTDICDNDDYDDLYDIVTEVAKFDIYDIPEHTTTPYCPIVKSRPDKEKIQILKDCPQPAQRTPEWYAFRQGVITASNIWKIFASEAQINSFIYDKCKNADVPPPPGGGYVNTQSSLHWGVKYEPLSTMLYEYRNRTQVGAFGCIRHSRYEFLAASPDGINIAEDSSLYGRMLEIKNIVNRDIDGNPSPAYWIQMQIQMECCDLEECDFLETRFKEYASAEEFYQDEQHSELGEKGVILYFTSNIDGSPIYKYLPIGQTIPENTDLEDWTDLVSSYCPENASMKSILFWYLDEYSCVLVKRNRLWFEMAMPKIADMWNLIQKEKVEGFEHRSPKKKTKTSSNTNGLLVEIDEDGGSHVIHNMPVTNSYSIIKTT